jgi:DNA ligase-1
MADLKDGESSQVQGSGARSYTIKNTAGVYSCSCPAWMHQSLPIEKRSCKHLRALRGDEAEEARVGAAVSAPRKPRSGEAQAPPVLLAERWDSAQDPTGWWLSEKLDGVRAYWDGEGFLSRQGNRYLCPDWFCQGLPSTPLDGELWVGRKKFQRTVSIVRRADRSEHWREVRYLVFDAPGDAEASFEDRLARAAAELEGVAHAALHPHTLCEGVEHLQAELARVEQLGGEGLMLRKPRSRYVAGRSATLLKVKNFHDAEARVLEHLPGAGRHKGRCGALRVELEDGTLFSVGTGLSDAERDDPPAVGSVITFRYQELTDDGVPRFPSYVGVRHDHDWGAEPPAKKAASKKKPASKKKAATSEKKASAGRIVTKESAAPMDGDRRYLEFVGGSSSKFWEVTIKGSELHIRYGRIGNQGTTQLKRCDDEVSARREATKLAATKLKKGYEEPG